MPDSLWWYVICSKVKNKAIFNHWGELILHNANERQLIVRTINWFDGRNAFKKTQSGLVVDKNRYKIIIIIIQYDVISTHTNTNKQTNKQTNKCNWNCIFKKVRRLEQYKSRLPTVNIWATLESPPNQKEWKRWLYACRKQIRYHANVSS